MSEIQNKNYLNGIYVSKGLGIVVFLFFMAVFVTVTLVTGQITVDISTKTQVVKNQTCQILQPSFSSEHETVPVKIHKEYNINILNLFNNYFVNGSCIVDINLPENTKTLNLNLKSLIVSNVYLYDKNLAVIYKTQESQSQDKTSFYIKKGTYRLVFDFNNVNNPIKQDLEK